MGSHSFEWLQDKSLGWLDALPNDKIDVHHHFVPEFFAKGESFLLISYSFYFVRFPLLPSS
jgi:hypothetical protein